VRSWRSLISEKATLQIATATLTSQQITSPTLFRKDYSSLYKAFKYFPKTFETSQTQVMSNTPIYEFGPFQLDAGERLLRRGEETIPLTLKAFETLLVLVKSSGRIIEKEELLKTVWPDTFVEESTLAQNIFTLRKILGKDESGRSYIATIHRRGYRFVAPVSVVEVETEAVPDNRLALAVNAKAPISVTARKGHNSIAVLEFDNDCNDPSVDYLSEGITESIINSLSRLPSLRVMSRTTILQYKGKGMDPQEVGRELGVPTVLAGRLLRLEDRLVIRVELIDVQHGWQIWGEQYNKEISDIFKIQEDVANRITNRLESKLTSAEQKQLVIHATGSLEAYELYLRGRYYWNKRSSEGYRKAKECFREAINIDPDFALAYSGYADARCLECVGFYGVQPTRAVMPEAKRAALKSIEINDQLSEGHTSLAYILLNYEWDWEGAEREFKRALELNISAHTCRWYAHYLVSVGRSEEALFQTKLALEMEPFDPTITQHVGWYYLFSRQYEQAIKQFLSTLDAHPDFYPSHVLLGLAYVHTGYYEKAIKEFQEAIRLEKLAPAVALLGYAYAMAGKRADAMKVLDDLLDQSAKFYISPYGIARIYIGLNEKDEAFTWLQKAFEERNEWMTALKINPELDSLRDDPRFDILLRRVGLE
jgi:TolB-like protein